MSERHDNHAIVRNPSIDTRWKPKDLANGELARILNDQDLPDKARRQLRDSALSILAACGDPTAIGSSRRTGLIVGYVQSGKTLSFTTVAAAAIDNGYKAVVVLGGSSRPLSEQNADRLEEDLAVLSGFDSKWAHWHRPKRTQASEMRDKLESKLAPRALLLTAMKHQKDTRDISSILESLGESAQPTLIIDDEADSISLNSVARRQRETRNYSEICELRDRNPAHVYLQYTATPQAPILISVLDRLAPDFGAVLKPGDGYLGGKQIFIDQPESFIRHISADEVDRASADHDEGVTVPQSLHRALCTYLLGVAQWWHIRNTLQERPPSHLSMMIHPHQQTAPHEQYAGWVRQFVDRVKAELPNESEPGRSDLVGLFRDCYTDLQSTDKQERLGSFESLLSLVPEAIKTVQVQEFRGNRKPDKGWKTAWKSQPHWILIGGQLLDRGFTVEGLSVTYMPRAIGGGQADTIQQRARFFGYKSEYASLCRIFLTTTATQAYTDYVDHEESIRSWLSENKDKLKDRDTIRRFRLSRTLRPTRQGVYTSDVFRASSSAWFFQQCVEGRHVSTSRFDRNESEIADFCKSRTCEVEHSHKLYKTTVGELSKGLLAGLVVAEEEASEWEARLIELAEAVKREPTLAEGQAWVIEMRATASGRPNERALTSDGTRILEVPAGRNASGYAGDRKMRRGLLTLQVHRFLVDRHDHSSDASTPIIPILGIWADKRLRPQVVIQNQERFGHD